MQFYIADGFMLYQMFFALQWSSLIKKLFVLLLCTYGLAINVWETMSSKIDLYRVFETDLV